MTVLAKLQTPARQTAHGETARYDAMCRAIEAAYAVDEVKDIRGQAIALETYARQAHNVEAERKACEIRLRAERKAGTLSAKLERAQGARTDKPRATMDRSSTKAETASCRRHHAPTVQTVGKTCRRPH